ncbi:MAG: hypothetical protein HYU00_03835, partial [Nitrosarchaeum sp.]|nr:hypothetical protein [Nitrosarchaeum sp.]
MKHIKILTFMVIFTLAATISISPAFSVPQQANFKAKEITTVSIPENAKKIGDGVYDLGYKVHDGQILQGTLYVFSDKEFAKLVDQEESAPREAHAEEYINIVKFCSILLLKKKESL